MLAETVELYENWLVAFAGVMLLLSLVTQYRILKVLKEKEGAMDGEYIVRVGKKKK